MTENRSRPTPTSWTLPKFHFQVKWGHTVTVFAEVSGLTAESQPIEYRRGDSPRFAAAKLPGLSKHGSVTLKRGLFRGDEVLLAWLQRGAAGAAERKPVTVTLIDEAGSPTMVWTLTNAFPTKFVAPDMNATANEVAIESIDLGYEGLTVENA